ncbi:Gfo/Idh/MocA family protein [Nocardia fusca]|uniref:Gfo/Idh/MocA family protein n=1 Tax=Nocardia fusca TaxID=941183 RepID=UPI0007A75245|nr:Gfo/Idh/MocA family oxidoreductase [Nocardia fusca]
MSTSLKPSPLRIGIIGAGVMGTKHAEFIDRERNATLVGVADPFSTTLADTVGVPNYSDYHDLLAAPDIDAVIIANPNGEHVPTALAAIDAGIPALLEKPVAISANEASVLSTAVDEAGGVVLVGHHRRHHPAVAAAREMIRGGELGRIVAVNGMWLTKKSDQYFEQPWRRTSGAGVMLINLVHDLDLVRYLIGEVTTVQAIASNAARGYEVEDTAAVIVGFDNGAVGTFIVSDTVVAPWGWDQSTQDDPQFPFSPDASSYSIAGTEGSLTFPQLGHYYHDGESNWNLPLSRRFRAIASGDSYTGQLRHFIDVARGTAAPIVTVDDAAATLNVIESAHRSAETGALVAVEPVQPSPQ